MKKLIALMLIFALSFNCVFADALDTMTYEAYSAEEFPDWANKLRRGESLFFGTLPITFAITGLIVGIANSGNTPLGGTEASQTLISLGIGAGASLIVALTDFFLGLE